MRLSLCAVKLGLLLALSSGCGQHPNDGPSNHGHPIVPVLTLSIADTSDSTKADEQSHDVADHSTSVTEDQSENRSIAPQAGLRRLTLAVGDRTAMGQSLPEEIKNQWFAKIRSLDEGDSSWIRIVTDPADADWLVQVAAIERTDILYLTPAERQGTPADDELWRMLPPGESVTVSLKAELEHIARYGNLKQTLQPQTTLNPQPVELEAEPNRKPSNLQSGQNADPSPAAQDDDVSDGKVQASPAWQNFLDVWGKKRSEEVNFAKATTVFGFAHHGPAEDLKTEIVEEQSGVYHTSNRTQAVLGTYGKMVEGNRLLGRMSRFEHRGIVRELERVRRFTTVQRVGSGTGKDFVSFVGNRQAWQIIDLAAQVSGGHHEQVAFEILGVRLDQNDVIKALNADDDALGYFDYLRQHKQTPCFVLENVAFTSYTTASDSNMNLGAKAKTGLTSDGAEARVENQRSSFMQLTSPVIRCYQVYEVKMDGRQIVELVCLQP